MEAADTAKIRYGIGITKMIKEEIWIRFLRKAVGVIFDELQKRLSITIRSSTPDGSEQSVVEISYYLSADPKER